MTVKTTIYLPDDMKAGIERVAREQKCSEAEVIRRALDEHLAGRSAPAYPLPDFPLWDGEPDFSDRVDEFLKGFGER